MDKSRAQAEAAPPWDELRLKLAIQKSGRLTEPSLDLLVRCGLKISRGKDQLMAYGENMPLDVLFVRDDDIPDLVQEDVCDLGLVGRNVLEEKRLESSPRAVHPARFRQVRTLGFRPLPSRTALAVPGGHVIFEGARTRCEGKRIATTSTPTFSSGTCASATSSPGHWVTLSGAVEIAPRLGRADLICDLVSTGSTLQANHLREVETVLESHAVLIRTPLDLPPDKDEWVQRLLMRIDGVQQVRESKYIMLHAQRSALAEIRKLLPGSESPTIIPLEGFPDRVAVHASSAARTSSGRRWKAWKKAEASALLVVLPVEKMLA